MVNKRELKQLVFQLGYYNINRVLSGYHKKIEMNNEHVEAYREFGFDGKDVYFGYYDLNPFSADGNRLLTIAVDDKCDVGFFDMMDGSFNHVTFSLTNTVASCGILTHP